LPGSRRGIKAVGVEVVRKEWASGWEERWAPWAGWGINRKKKRRHSTTYQVPFRKQITIVEEGNHEIDEAVPMPLGCQASRESEQKGKRRRVDIFVTGGPKTASDWRKRGGKNTEGAGLIGRWKESEKNQARFQGGSEKEKEKRVRDHNSQLARKQREDNATNFGKKPSPLNDQSLKSSRPGGASKEEIKKRYC